MAVLGVAARLMSLVRGSLKHENYGLVDIVLYGNYEMRLPAMVQSKVIKDQFSFYFD